MRTITAFLVGLALVVAVSGCSRKSGAATAADAMDATSLNSIQFSGSGTNYAFGQAYSPGGPWPRLRGKNLHGRHRLPDARYEARDAGRAG
jgi:hypothetical protein